MATVPINVNSYIQNLPAERQKAISSLRRIVFDVVPDAEESIEYKMPMYKIGGQAVCAFASQKNYISLYINPDVVEAHKNKLTGFDIGKSCIRFKKIEDMPEETVRALIEGVVKSL